MIPEAEQYEIDAPGKFEEAYAQFGRREYSIDAMEYFPPCDDTCKILRWLKEQRPEAYILMVTSITIEDAEYGRLFSPAWTIRF